MKLPLIVVSALLCAAAPVRALSIGLTSDGWQYAATGTIHVEFVWDEIVHTGSGNGAIHQPVTLSDGSVMGAGVVAGQYLSNGIVIFLYLPHVSEAPTTSIIGLSYLQIANGFAFGVPKNETSSQILHPSLKESPLISQFINVTWAWNGATGTADATWGFANAAHSVPDSASTLAMCALALVGLAAHGRRTLNGTRGL